MKTTHLYYLPEVDVLVQATSDKREVVIIYIRSIDIYVPFDAIYIGEL